LLLTLDPQREYAFGSRQQQHTEQDSSSGTNSVSHSLSSLSNYSNALLHFWTQIMYHTRAL